MRSYVKCVHQMSDTETAYKELQGKWVVFNPYWNYMEMPELEQQEFDKVEDALVFAKKCITKQLASGYLTEAEAAYSNDNDLIH